MGGLAATVNPGDWIGKNPQLCECETPGFDYTQWQHRQLVPKPQHLTEHAEMCYGRLFVLLLDAASDPVSVV